MKVCQSPRVLLAAVLIFVTASAAQAQPQISGWEKAQREPPAEAQPALDEAVRPHFRVDWARLTPEQLRQVTDSVVALQDGQSTLELWGKSIPLSESQARLLRTWRARLLQRAAVGGPGSLAELREREIEVVRGLLAELEQAVRNVEDADLTDESPIMGRTRDLESAVNRALGACAAVLGSVDRDRGEVATLNGLITSDDPAAHAEHVSELAHLDAQRRELEAETGRLAKMLSLLGGVRATFSHQQGLARVRLRTRSRAEALDLLKRFNVLCEEAIQGLKASLEPEQK